jgi:drug/metabolite transporter (DMT)-like permease
MIFWSGSWVSAKVISVQSPAETISFWRFLLTSLAAFPFYYFGRRRLQAEHKKQTHLESNQNPSKSTENSLLNARKGATNQLGSILWSISLGVLGLSVYNLLFFNGLKVYPGGKAGVLVTTSMPLFSFLLGRIVNREKFTPLQILGLILGLGGGLMQAWPQDGLWDPVTVLFIASAFSWAVLSLGSSRIPQSLGVMGFTFWVYGLSAVTMGLLILYQGMSFFPTTGVLEFWLNVVYLAVPAGVYGTGIYFAATKRLGSGSGSSSTFVIPLFALLLSWIFFGETPRVYTLIGGSISIVAITLIQWGIGKTGAPTPLKEKH